jgi:hypothetical protein
LEHCILELFLEEIFCQVLKILMNQKNFFCSFFSVARFLYVHLCYKYKLLIYVLVFFASFDDQMDRSWIHSRLFSPEHIDGVKQFMSFIQEKFSENVEFYAHVVDV